MSSLFEILGKHDAAPVSGGDICSAYRVATADGLFFAKTPNRPDPHLLPVEADGLLALAAIVPGLMPEVVHVDADWLVLPWIEEQPPTAQAAESLGRRLAQLHAGVAGAFGEGPDHGRIGSLPMPAGNFDSWPQMYAQLRLLPLVGPDLPACRQLVDVLMSEPGWAGPAEPPSLLHGDLWAGNIVWAQTPVLIDPACHVGHRETDLAMLSLFSAPHLDQLLAAYDEQYPLAEGWRNRVGLHQLWPLLVHARLFGSGYAQRAERIATGYLRLR